jgi:hypothetical protein
MNTIKRRSEEWPAYPLIALFSSGTAVKCRFGENASTVMKYGWIGLALGVKMAWAVTAPCPVTLEKVKRDSGLGDRNTYCFSLEAANHSSRAIRVVKLGAVAIDSKPWEHPLRFTYEIEKIPPGVAKSAYFSTHRLLGTDYRGIKLWVESIEFDDQSSWKDNGSRACGSEDVRKK